MLSRQSGALVAQASIATGLEPLPRSSTRATGNLCQERTCNRDAEVYLTDSLFSSRRIRANCPFTDPVSMPATLEQGPYSGMLVML